MSFLYFFIEIDLIIKYIYTFNSLVASDLLIKEQQKVEDLKNAGDETIVSKEKNCKIFLFVINNFFIVFESEAFLFTSKKTMENSKKLSKRLKELDV